MHLKTVHAGVRTTNIPILGAPDIHELSEDDSVAMEGADAPYVPMVHIINNPNGSFSFRAAPCAQSTQASATPMSLGRQCARIWALYNHHPSLEVTQARTGRDSIIQQKASVSVRPELRRRNMIMLA